MSLDQAPHLSGSYALLLRLDRPLKALSVGRMGCFDFASGEYIYLGSARGPGGLLARLAHHARCTPRPHWHIDYLRRHARLLGAWAAEGQQQLECAWSQALHRLPGASLPAPGFGAADCRLGCPSHLLCCPPELVGQVLRQSATHVVWYVA